MKNMYFISGSIADKYFEENCRKIYDDVYCFNNDIVIKKYDKRKSMGVYPEHSDLNLLQFKDIDIEGFSFNKALVYTGLFNIYGIITKFIEGNTIKDVYLSSYSIDDVIRAVSEIDNSIKKISDLNIRVNDIHDGNIIFDGNKITMIDTSEYYYSKQETQIYEENMLRIMDVLFKNIFYSVGKDRFIKHVYNVHKYFSIRGSKFYNFRDFEYLMNPVETLVEIRNFMEEDFGVKLNTFSECHNYVDEIVNNEQTYKRVLTKRK